MTSPQKPLFDRDSDDQSARGEYEELRVALQQHIDEFIETRELSLAMMALLLMDLSVTARMVDYALSVERPSGSGLKLELDRFRREIDDFTRASKKSADVFIAASRQVLAAEEADKPE
jgi:hypothetical protein